MGMTIRMTGRGLLAAVATASLAGVGAAAPARAATFAGSLTAPGIHSVSPARGPAGTKVTITGSGFTRVTAVRFRGMPAAFTVRSASRITAVVPAMPSGAGRITVTTRAGTAASRARFTVSPAVALSAVTGPPGSVVMVSGTGFGAAEGADIFAGTTDEALAGTGPAGSFGPVRVTIPASAVPGTEWISAEGRHTRLFAQIAFSVNTDWAQPGFSAAHTGTNPYENVLSTADVARLSLDWSFRTSATSPAVVNGVVYIGSVGDVYAINAATGTRKWRSTTKDEAGDSSPAVANGTVYVGSGAGLVYALNAATGAKKWTFFTRAAAGSPVVANGVVYVASRDGHLYALNAATGRKLWQFTTGSDLFADPAVASGVVYIGSADGTVYALDATTGAKKWTFTTGNFIVSSPAVANGEVCIASSDGHVYAFNAADPAKLWTFSTGGPIAIGSSSAVANGVVYIGSEDHNVYALDATTGAKLWTFTTGNFIVSSPAVANGVVYIGSEDDNVYALDATTGAKLWAYTTSLGVDSSPTVANGMVYVSEFNQHVDAFGLTGGHATPARPNRNSLHPNVKGRGSRERVAPKLPFISG